jgi:hypothetical protein
MLATYGAAKSVIAAALRRKFWNAIVFFLALGDAFDFIKFWVLFQISYRQITGKPKAHYSRHN